MHRARAWFAAHGITRIDRIVTDNGACYRADACVTKESNPTPHAITEKWSATTEFSQKCSSTRARGHQSKSEQLPSAYGTSTTTTTGRTAHLEDSHRPHGSPQASPTSWPHTSRGRMWIVELPPRRFASNIA
jgi:hypothetical protein